MNQAIQVLDGCTYIAVNKAIKIDVMVAAEIIACYICGQDEKSLMSLYKIKQFEIEEIIEQKLEQNKINADGEVWLTVQEVSKF